jgi:protein-S-isoprenylcysteine O-methyltransferase Ste14
MVCVFIVRTILEDRTLTNELPGYAEYTHKVRYRILPGIW